MKIKIEPMVETKKRNRKKTISQWCGVLLTLPTLPLLFSLTATIGTSVVSNTILGLILGLLFFCVTTYLLALFISTIIYFIIK